METRLCTGRCQAFLDRQGLRYGDDIVVFRAGDVVPQTKCRIDSPHQADATPYIFTNQCPSCGGAITKRGESWYCMDVLNCPAQVSNRIIRATGRECLGIDSFGAKLAESLVELGLVAGYDDIFTLSKHRDDLIAMEGYGGKSVDKLLLGIEKAKQVPFERFIYLLGINEVGRSLSRTLANKYRTIDALASASYADLLDTEDVGEVTASSIVEYFSSQENIQLIEKLLAVGMNVIQPEVVNIDEMAINYNGKTFVVTGTFSGISRSEIENFIKAHGGKVSGSPSAKTFATIVGDKAGSKLQKSIDLNLPIISDADIVRITGNDISKLRDALVVNTSDRDA